MPTNSWCHVAVTLDGSQGLLYLNGNPVGYEFQSYHSPVANARPQQLLGKSQFAVDPLFSGEIGSFRVFGRPLSGDGNPGHRLRPSGVGASL